MISGIAQACGQRYNQEVEYFREWCGKRLSAYVSFLFADFLTSTKYVLRSGYIASSIGPTG